MVALSPTDKESSGTNRLLVLERGRPAVTLLTDEDGDDVPDNSRILATASGLNHALAVHGGYLYASSDTTVYRRPFHLDGLSKCSASSYDFGRCKKAPKTNSHTRRLSWTYFSP